MTSTAMLWLQTNKPGSGTMNLGGSLTRQVSNFLTEKNKFELNKDIFSKFLDAYIGYLFVFRQQGLIHVNS